MPKRRDQRGVRVNPLIASMTGRVVDTFLRKGRHKPGPEPVDPPTPSPDPPPPITCPCNAFRIADFAYQELSLEERLVWRKALKKRKMSGYDLWMKECIVALEKTGYFPECPSVSGGFACHNLILSDRTPTAENTIGLFIPEPEPPWDPCAFHDDFTGPDEQPVSERLGWYAPAGVPMWKIKDNYTRQTGTGGIDSVRHLMPEECGQRQFVAADVWFDNWRPSSSWPYVQLALRCRYDPLIEWAFHLPAESRYHNTYFSIRVNGGVKVSTPGSVNHIPVSARFQVSGHTFKAFIEDLEILSWDTPTAWEGMEFQLIGGNAGDLRPAIDNWWSGIF